MVRQWQELFNDKRYSFVDIQSPDFVGLQNPIASPDKKLLTVRS